MVGASIAFFGEPGRRAMHSHITALLPEYRGRGWGRELKEHQRQWAFSREVGRITWTFDPLVARNAHFFLTVLGARVTGYAINVYGIFGGGDAGDESDRLDVEWALADIAKPPASDAVAGDPRDPRRHRDAARRRPGCRARAGAGGSAPRWRSCSDAGSASPASTPSAATSSQSERIPSGASAGEHEVARSRRD